MVVRKKALKRKINKEQLQIYLDRGWQVVLNDEEQEINEDKKEPITTKDKKIGNKK